MSCVLTHTDTSVGTGWIWFPIPLLPLAGRVARAGRSGTAYSLVAPDELPYVFDLHLFLGRPLILAGAQEMPAGEGWLCGKWVLPLASAGVCGLVLGPHTER